MFAHDEKYAGFHYIAPPRHAINGKSVRQQKERPNWSVTALSGRQVAIRWQH